MAYLFVRWSDSLLFTVVFPSLCCRFLSTPISDISYSAPFERSTLEHVPAQDVDLEYGVSPDPFAQKFSELIPEA